MLALFIRVKYRGLKIRTVTVPVSISEMKQSLLVNNGF